MSSVTDQVWSDWLAAQGGQGARIAAFDWAATPLGPLDTWPPALCDAVSLCIGSLLPMAVQWGRELILIPNDACRDIVGADRFESSLGRPTLEVWPESQGHITDNVLPVLRDGTPYFAVDELFLLNRRVPLEECFLTVSTSPIMDDGVPGGVFTAFIETTPEVLAARRLRTLAELGRDVNESPDEFDVTTDVLGVLATNPSDHPAGAVYVVDDEQHLSTMATFGDASLITDEAGAVALRATHGNPATGEDVDGSGWHALPVRGLSGDEVTHVLLLARPASRPLDMALTAYHALVAHAIGGALLSRDDFVASRRRVAEMTAIDTAKSAFFAGVSHELRTPLALISAPVQDILERDPGLSDATRKALALVQSNVARLGRMVEAMLDFSRMEAGRLVPAIESVDVAGMMRALADDFAPAFARAGIEFVVDVPDLPTPPLLDRDFLERIVSNLLSNALKYTPAGRVQLRLFSDGDHYAIEVSDTGIGVRLEDLDRIFAKFERLPTRPGARSAAGAGIGLAMVRQLSRLLDGEVTVESTVGEGTTFTVRLPVRPERPLGVAGESVTPRRVSSFLAEIDTWVMPEQPVGEPSGGATSGRLLVVEDDPQMARFLADMLGEDYDVVTVADGRAAMEALEGDEVDIVLTDLAMPNMDGIELVRRIRADERLRQLPVVLLSASGDGSARGLAMGADDYVVKPFTIEDVRDRLASNLARARERSADAAWRRAVLHALRDPLVIFDREGRVVELNQAFTDMFGYSMADGPLTPPFPWWPTEEENAEARAAITEWLENALATEDVDAEVLFYTVDRRPIWVHSTGSSVDQPRTGLSARIRVLRDITRDKQARDRRAAAARVSADFAHAEDLETLLGVAEHGFELLFDGGSTIQVMVDRPYVFASGKAVRHGELPEEVAAGLGGEPSPDTTNPRSGILLVPATSTTDARAWVQFPRPRRISLDELIAADLLAQAFGLAVDRVVALQKAEQKQANLEQAVDSHRLIGQAVGILVERHRITAGEAFGRLRQASQNRNLKLRDVASRVVETGAEPDEA